MSSRLYVGNLSYETDTETLRQAFAAAGEVTDAHVVMDRESGRSRGFGFVTMATPDLAKKAIETMNGSMIDGRAIRVNEAEERPRGGGGGFGGGGRGGGGGFGGGGGGFGGGGFGGGGRGGGDFGGRGGRGGGGGGDFGGGRGGRGGGRGGARGR
ncbi:MAG: RNA-binding protein [Myxococcales bacterium 68-20]|nr:RNA-binding protein [Myxococcales bacterium]OJY16662.1 MAG: RNA-binding protein [Myxococcales bacterium 68-20]